MMKRILFALVMLMVQTVAVMRLAAAEAPGDAVIKPGIPPTISQQARRYYEQVYAQPRRSAGDIQDPEHLAFVRDLLDKIFLKQAREIRTDYTLEKVTPEGVPSIWISTPGMTRGGKVILYLHGGGYILGSAEANLANALRIGPAAGIKVLSVDYRLAPEHPFPAGLEDARTVYHWLLAHGFASKDIVVYGDSSGGGLALALGLSLKQNGEPLPAAIAAISPVTDLLRQGDTNETLKWVDPSTRGADPETGHDVLYAGDHDRHDPLISPVFGDYAGYPPLLLQVGTRDVLLSDSIRLARKARSDGADVTLDIWEGMWHVWHDHPDVPEAQQASEAVAAFFLDHLGGEE